ncbi:LysR family transcriptional regulator [Pseudomonas umsongensis]|jgi:DNA-binding transcriptional LysR family regulator|uniref:DNA-binding transcriptional regulator, LysR family n=1 Tax=Pseudomonas migulae TaxID=78543 RepID=A0A1H5FKY9_9PSED|nr:MULTISPECIES: LysR family transcriptional regulator [Pseudomonas]MBU0520803.1 LysR family transcriptional regulator [Gammaproteobacteria bacterium]SEB88554.1 DNA-binding transcriptional regulator, LysR family [Pseudomonas marginalis]MBU0844495.1 LysR family transcriptional regulator [Gammaproteobacteria bacterium]MBU1840219.1 LysR family transcriptional regulator [Gammaproteobacteria bacterium]QFG27887.1 LysR family transcriptional regulator [Pseudomonas umsongensis]
MDYFAALKSFVRAAELKSFTRVALDLSIQTSTASRHISDLETDLRIALFNRTTRGLSLTEGGTVFYEKASQLLLQLDEAREAASSLNRNPAGVLRVTLPGAFGRRHIMPWINEFLAKYPDIEIEAIFTDETLNLIESRIDLGIRIGSLKDSSLIARRLAPQQRIACASRDYIKSHGAPSKPSELNTHSCLAFSRTPDKCWYAERKTLKNLHPVGKDVADCLVEETTDSSNAQIEALEQITISGAFAANDSEALLEATLGGLGIALLPSWLIQAQLSAGRLIDVLPDWDMRITAEAPSIWAVYPYKKTVSSKVRTFVDFLIEKIGNPPYWDTNTPRQ